MWNRPWRLAEGICIGAGLIVVGLLLQFTIGSIDWQLIAYPLNAILLVVFMLVLCVLYAVRKRFYIISWTMTMTAAVPAIAYGVLVTLLMALTGYDEMLRSWPLVLIYIWLMNILGLTALHRLLHITRGGIVHNVCHVCNHLGLFMAMVCGTLGNADMQRLSMTVRVGSPEWRALDKRAAAAGQGATQTAIRELPLAIELRSFSIDEYPPKYVIIDNTTGQVIKDTQWQVRQDTLLEYAAIRPQADSTAMTSYIEWRSMGACTAACVTATQPSGQQVSGWVSCGNFMFPYQALRLDDRCSVVMPEREPRRYTSEVTVYTQAGDKQDALIEVNHPLEIDGWKIYQLSYDEALGRWSDTSVFELVRDPWLPYVYAGIFMMLLGAALNFLTAGHNAPKTRQQ